MPRPLSALVAFRLLKHRQQIVEPPAGAACVPPRIVFGKQRRCAEVLLDGAVEIDAVPPLGIGAQDQPALVRASFLQMISGVDP